jgi:hypothetical protein
MLSRLAAGKTAPCRCRRSGTNGAMGFGVSPEPGPWPFPGRLLLILWGPGVARRADGYDPAEPFQCSSAPLDGGVVGAVLVQV